MLIDSEVFCRVVALKAVVDLKNLTFDNHWCAYLTTRSHTKNSDTTTLC